MGVWQLVLLDTAVDLAVLCLEGKTSWCDWCDIRQSAVGTVTSISSIQCWSLPSKSVFAICISKYLHSF